MYAHWIQEYASSYPFIQKKSAGDVRLKNFCETIHKSFLQLYFKKNRNGHERCSKKKSVLWNFTKFRGKQLCQSLFFNKVTGLRPATLLQKRLWHSCFPVNFAKFLRTPLDGCFWKKLHYQLQKHFQLWPHFLHVKKVYKIRSFQPDFIITILFFTILTSNFLNLICQVFAPFWVNFTAQKMKFSIKNFFNKCDQIHTKLQIWLHLMRKSWIENFIFVQCWKNGVNYNNVNCETET